MRSIVLATLFNIALLNSYAGNGPGKAVEEKGSQKIQVVDFSNLESLAGASIYIEELDKTVYADFDGFVGLDGIPEGEYHISVQLISYEKVEIENFEVGTKAGITKLRLKSTIL